MQTLCPSTLKCIKKCAANVLSASKHQERHGFCFWTLNDRKKGAADTFRGDKLTIKVCLN